MINNYNLGCIVVGANQISVSGGVQVISATSHTDVLYENKMRRQEAILSSCERRHSGTAIGHSDHQANVHMERMTRDHLDLYSMCNVNALMHVASPIKHRSNPIQSLTPAMYVSLAYCEIGWRSG